MRFSPSKASALVAALASSTFLAQEVDAAAINAGNTAKLPLCSTVNNSPQYDYIVVGSGPGGGPLAARLALKGFKVLVVDAGHDVNNVNTTVPFYFARSNDDPQLALDYYANLYSPASQVADKSIQDWYPRAMGLGGSAIHNALINVVQMKWDLDNIASITGDSSWSSDNVRPYFNKLEKNDYLASSSATASSHGYSGWLSTDQAPTNLLSDPQYFDQQFLDLFNSVQASQPFLPGADINAAESDGVAGGAIFPITTDSSHNRSSVRDFLVNTRSSTSKLQTKLDTLATKILLCKSSTASNANVVAYGVSVASGASLLPVARKFGGKRSLSLTSVTAKYEVIVATGVYQTPQLLQLSGLGPSAQLNKYKIPVVVDLPGVGENLQDRLELSVLYSLKQDHVIYKGCTFDDTVQVDPCLQAWSTDGHTNLYSAGAAVWATVGKSAASVPYNDIWNMFIAGPFTGYFPGYGNVFRQHHNIFGAAILKGHAAARGWVRLTSSNPQDKLEINKNLYTNAASIADKTAIREQVKAIRTLFTTTPDISKHIVSEYYPGNATSTDAQIDAFIDVHAWGHHACCTAKMGAASDSTAVVNSAFQVFGVSNLRIVDNSVWPVIPGLFVTTPLYMMSEKAADTVIAYAASKGWNPSS